MKDNRGLGIYDPEAFKTFSYSDPEFYQLEMQVLERLRDTSSSDRTITSVCKDLNIDQYDFKDRWGPMLRNHSPGEIIENVTSIRPKVGNSVHEVAKELGLPFGTVRTIVKKLMVTPNSQHQRTKENLAHRLIATSGGSLRDAKAQLGRTMKLQPKKEKRNEDDSMYSSDESHSEISDDNRESDSNRRKPAIKVEKITGRSSSGEPLERKPPVKAINFRTNVTWYESTINLLSSIEQIPTELKGPNLHPELQLRVLEDIHKGTDPQKACQKLSMDFPLFRKMWSSLLKLVPAQFLDASVFAIVTLSRLGYGLMKISQYLCLTRAYVNTVLSNLHLDLGPSDCRSFDVTMLLVNKEMLTGSRISELCKAQVDLGKLIVKRNTQKEQYVNKVTDAIGDPETCEAFAWLYERGLNIQVICAVLRVPRGVVRSVLPDEEV